MLIKQISGILPNSSVTYRAANGTGAAATITIAAVAGVRTVIHAFQWSYSATPTGGKITVTDGGTTVLDLDITASGPGGFSCYLPGSVNSQVVITLASAGGVIVGKLNVQTSAETI